MTVAYSEEQVLAAFENKRKLIKRSRDLREKKYRFQQAGRRLTDLFAGDFEELFADITTRDPLQFPDYNRKLLDSRMRTGAKDALICGIGTLDGIRVAAAELNPDFLMGSMGTVVGDKIAAITEEAGRRQLPLVIFSASGGARMQEGMYSLMQMAKTAAAVERFKKRGGFFISVLTHPTTGGVSASYAFLGDVILAEPGALIGFAGPRVIEQTIRQKLPKGFQRAEFQLEHGMVDRIVPANEMRETIAELLRLHGYDRSAEDREAAIHPAAASKNEDNAAVTEGFESMRGSGLPEQESSEREASSEANVKRKPDAWNSVLRARDTARPKMADFIPNIFESFFPLCGDRLGGEDGAVLGGIARLNGRPVTVIGHRKGKDLKENLECRFGMPEPEGYRKALRLMREAEKFGRPVITWVDTPGAYPGKEAEENGQSAAIAENLAAMSDLRVPILSIVTGEGASGGALALSVADSVWMLEHAVYYVLSPEGFASILWKDEKRAAEASRVMRLTAEELVTGGIADRVIPEPKEGISLCFDEFCSELKQNIVREVERLEAVDRDQLTEMRYLKYRNFERLTEHAD
ncbi:MAG: acetyl-CoA carboxylase carboxyltransferase subunit alpha/beta [Lachnospiraceae bacterium]|nr:acetyl-CoA carboxylase carboxyltransferase subunit alpha/beta [Lachnospiraceae bacterium]